MQYNNGNEELWASGNIDRNNDYPDLNEDTKVPPSVTRPEDNTYPVQPPAMKHDDNAPQTVESAAVTGVSANPAYGYASSREAYSSFSDGYTRPQGYAQPQDNAAFQDFPASAETYYAPRPTWQSAPQPAPLPIPQPASQMATPLTSQSSPQPTFQSAQQPAPQPTPQPAQMQSHAQVSPPDTNHSVWNQPPVFNQDVRESNFAPNPAYATSGNNWCDPSYRQTYEPVSGMYTPGIGAGQPYTYKRDDYSRQPRKPRERSGGPGRFVRAVCLILACAVCSGATAYYAMDYRFKRGDFTVSNQVVLGNTLSSPQGGNLLTPVSTSGTGMPAEDIYDFARSHVVGINTEMTGVAGSSGAQEQGPTTVVSGSGFIISSDGYILTNHHVIETADYRKLPIAVYLSDGTRYEATVIGYDTSSDFAILKIDAIGLNPAVIGDSDSIRVGQTVYAVGNPFGDLVYTMTEGIVSALDRVVTVDSKSIDTFQFSAAVNSGNSGGPVYNSNGEVIGIVTAKYMQESVEGIGFAIPINDAIRVASELIEHGYITGRPYLGIKVDTATNGLSSYYEWGVVGAFVKSVDSGSAAEKAGLKAGDIIIALGEAEVDSYNSLVYALRRYKAGDTTSLTVWRSGEKFELTITFDENMTAGQPQQSQQQPQTPAPSNPSATPPPSPSPSGQPGQPETP